jgi:actin-related protein
MAVNPIDSTQSTTDTQAKFEAAVDSSTQMSDQDLTNELVSQGVIIGGQFILMPKAQEMLNEAMSDDDE